MVRIPKSLRFLPQNRVIPSDVRFSFFPPESLFLVPFRAVSLRHVQQLPKQRHIQPEDFQILRDVVVNKRREEKIEKWIQDKINTTYVRISPDWRNCEFQYKGWVK